MEEQQSQNMKSFLPQSLATPVAIVIAGSIIAGAVIYTNYTNTNIVDTGNEEIQEDVEVSLDAVAPVTAEDHIRGNPDASFVIVEYSDFDCPFCQRFHDTMQQIMDEYGESGEVAWVYRHFPLDSLHPNAPAIAVASECAAEQGGDTAFWNFADEYFALSGSSLNAEGKVNQVVTELGLNQTSFNACFESGRHDEEIQAEFANAVETGGRGTPWSILIAPDGSKYPINGAQPYASVVAIIEGAR